MSEQEYDKEQLRILRNAFKAFDTDDRGYIEHSDVHTILEILGQKLDDKAIKELIKEVDKNNVGKIDFTQFCRLAARFVEVEEDTSNLASELKEAFRVYDKEGKGYLTTQTLRDILHELDDKITPQDLDMIIDEIDADGSGTVDFDEFMTVMTGKNFYDLTLERRFVFEPSHPRHCQCPTNRMRLHRRLEWHFDRFFQQLLQHPLELFTCRRRCLEPCVPSPSPSFQAIRNVFEPKPTKTSSTVVATTQKTCYRPIFRPRFPKWIPILTLYREVIQNPFKRRGHYMITHHE